MRDGHPTQLIPSVAGIIVFALATSGAWTGTEIGPGTRSSGPEGSYSVAESALIEFGMTRFHEQGLQLPDLRIEFLHDIRYCNGHLGLYYELELRLRMCSLDKKTMLHELAHAWANLNLSDEEKAAFSSSRDLRWNDRSDAWRERGTEHAAEIIAWGLADQGYSVRWVSTEAGVSVSDFRLITIGNGNVEALHRGFVLLTGMEPMFRSSIELSSPLLELEWQETSGHLISPEAHAPANVASSGG